MIMFIFLICISSSYANFSEWKIILNESAISFTGMKNNNSIVGRFLKFDGDIRFDPNKLSHSNVRVVIDMNSIYTPSKEFTSTLKLSDWFDVLKYPDAIFESIHFVKISEDTYRSKGSLTIKGKSIPILLVFTVDKLTENKILVRGTTSIKRSIFGVGCGQWSNVSLIKDDIKINFIITAVRKE